MPWYRTFCFEFFPPFCYAQMGKIWFFAIRRWMAILNRKLHGRAVKTTTNILLTSALTADTTSVRETAATGTTAMPVAASATPQKRQQIPVQVWGMVSCGNIMTVKVGYFYMYRTYKGCGSGPFFTESGSWKPQFSNQIRIRLIMKSSIRFRKVLLCQCFTWNNWIIYLFFYFIYFFMQRYIAMVGCRCGEKFPNPDPTGSATLVPYRYLPTELQQVPYLPIR